MTELTYGNVPMLNFHHRRHNGRSLMTAVNQKSTLMHFRVRELKILPNKICLIQNFLNNNHRNFNLLECWRIAFRKSQICKINFDKKVEAIITNREDSWSARKWKYRIKFVNRNIMKKKEELGCMFSIFPTRLERWQYWIYGLNSNSFST